MSLKTHDLAAGSFAPIVTAIFSPSDSVAGVTDTFSSPNVFFSDSAFVSRCDHENVTSLDSSSLLASAPFHSLISDVLSSMVKQSP